MSRKCSNMLAFLHFGRGIHKLQAVLTVKDLSGRVSRAEAVPAPEGLLDANCVPGHLVQDPDRILEQRDQLAPRNTKANPRLLSVVCGESSAKIPKFPNLRPRF